MPAIAVRQHAPYVHKNTHIGGYRSWKLRPVTKAANDNLVTIWRPLRSSVMRATVLFEAFELERQAC